MYKKYKLVLIKSDKDANIGNDNRYLSNSQQLVIDNKSSHLYILSEVVELLHKFRDSLNRVYDFSMEDWFDKNLK